MYNYYQIIVLATFFIKRSRSHQWCTIIQEIMNHPSCVCVCVCKASDI